IRHFAFSHPESKPFPCDICGEGLSSPSSLERHKVSRHDGVRHYCQYPGCERSFSLPHTLSQHETFHTDPDSLVCTEDLCGLVGGKSFANKGTLRVHQQLHSQDKEYTCPCCKEKFESFARLRHHRKQNPDERYPCKVPDCGLTFKYDCGLFNHMKIHEGVLHPCQECGKEFNTKQLLTEHEKSHLDIEYTCPEPGCGWVCANESGIRNHRQTKHSPTVFKCDQCGKECKSGKTLSRHKQSHRAKDIPCEIACGSMFKTNRHMKEHMKTVHGSK
ncbi:hypothetical protein K402DRAFT_429878, partial [Aulographum hederae CBS 113979]